MKDYVGFGALNEALQALEGEGYGKVLVVASKSGWERFLASGERPFFASRETRLFSDFNYNPEFSEILAGAQCLRDFQPDLLLAYGGGSPIDVAKVMKVLVFTKEPYDPEHPESLKSSCEGPPLVAIPTTAGSGSEATRFAVFYKDSIKQSLSEPCIRPEMAVVDPELTYTLPPAQTASTGFDGLCQSIEAYWAVTRTPEATEYAEASIKYIAPNLYNAVHSPEPGNRYHLAQGAYLSGKAINITRTTMPHALAYHLTKRYGVPHGHACALTLPYFFRLNADASLPLNGDFTVDENRRNMENLFVLLGQKSPEDCFEFWRNLMRACGLASTLTEVGVDTPAKMRAFVESMNMARMGTHPVRLEPDRLVDFFLRNP